MSLQRRLLPNIDTDVQRTIMVEDLTYGILSRPPTDCY